MPGSLNSLQYCLEKLGVAVMLKRRKSNVPLCSNLMEVLAFFQVGTRWTSDERVKETQPLRKFRKILLRGADNPGMLCLNPRSCSHYPVNDDIFALQ
jgi:hypothetical protein